MNPHDTLFAAKVQRPDARIIRVWMGKNWPEPKTPKITLSFDREQVHVYPTVLNDGDADSCVEWSDGYVTVLRSEDEPGFSSAPPKLGRARIGHGSKAGRTDAAARKAKRKGKR